MFTITRAGEAQLLRNMVGTPLSLRLYTNDVTVTRDTPLSAFKEPDGAGYRPTQLAPGKWKVVEGDPSVARYPPHEFVFQAAVGRIYGYLLVQDGTLLYSVRLPDDAPYYARWKGDTLVVQPILRLR